ncbi:hypothetical protein [Dendronalium sp. ChiSLP03b]|uniref:hypothetical protein n=1 Tax=Dendronalium sp. ChiSLP03b TaxID=3075381 RepID=UPI0039187D7E
MHGSRMKDFWEKANAEEPDSTKQQLSAENTGVNAALEEMRCKYTASISDETQREQGFEKPSRTVQEHLTNSSVEFVRCNSSTQDKNLCEDATADAPFGGASPQTFESVEEKEESPAVTDCTSLTLVDATPSQSASLMEEKPDLGDEVKAAHEDIFSAAPVAVNFENLSQSQNQAQPSLSASLMADDSSSRQEPKDHREDQSSALSVPQPDKWSSEAIALRSKARPWRIEKIKTAEVLKENPGFEFLLECWQEDPALQIVIKKLVAKFPQWGLVAVDGVLVKWEE